MNGIIFQNALLHNVAELVYDEAHADYRVCRIPEALRKQLNEKAQQAATYTCGCELRFRMCADEVEIVMRRNETPAHILPHGLAEVFIGDFQGSYEISPQPVGTEGSVIRIRRQDWSRVMTAAEAQASLFAPELVRVLLPYEWGNSIREIRGDILLPEPVQMPQKTLLCYGSSITHGGNATKLSSTYAFQLAEALGCDLRNLSMAGSAWLDAEMARYIAEQPYDIALFEIGINMLDRFSAEEIGARTEQFVRTVAGAHPERPLYVTNIYCHYRDLPGAAQAAAAKAGRAAVREAVARLQAAHPDWRLKLAEGLDLLGEFRGLSSDGLHPADKGHGWLAAHWAQAIANAPL